MNNLTCGNDRFQYYETICGGAGAGHGFHGATAVHTHMTNSRMTDPEILELRYPVIVSEFRIRAGSGGQGRWHGGDGVIRRITFREAMTVAILAGNRRIAPFGLSGGGAGATGRTYIERTIGAQELLDSCATAEVQAGDSIVVETPGGGGYGKPGREEVRGERSGISDIRRSVIGPIRPIGPIVVIPLCLAGFVSASPELRLLITSGLHLVPKWHEVVLSQLREWIRTHWPDGVVIAGDLAVASEATNSFRHLRNIFPDAPIALTLGKIDLCYGPSTGWQSLS